MRWVPHDIDQLVAADVHEVKPLIIRVGRLLMIHGHISESHLTLHCLSVHIEDNAVVKLLTEAIAAAQNQDFTLTDRLYQGFVAMDQHGTASCI